MKRELRAEDIRRALEMFAETINDVQALEIVSMYPDYYDLVEEKAIKEKNFRFSFNGELFKIAQPACVFDGVYEPGAPGTESLYTRIPKPNAGTLDDPIEYKGNLELESGKYYIEENIIYRCTRGTGAAVYHKLSELVGIYVEVWQRNAEQEVRT